MTKEQVLAMRLVVTTRLASLAIDKAAALGCPKEELERMREMLETAQKWCDESKETRN